MLSLHRSYVLLTALLAASTLGASSLSAQEVVAPAMESAADAQAAGASSATAAKGAPALPLGLKVPSPFASPISITPFEVPTPVVGVAVQDRVRPGQNILLMTLGGAGIVTGLIVGGDTGTIIATTGAVVGLIGLFRYLN
jgi:hypothetical protein